MAYHIFPDETLSKYVLDKKVEGAAEKVNSEIEGGAIVPRNIGPPCANSRPARFDYVPWFIESHFFLIWSAALFGGFTTSVSIALTANNEAWEGFDPLVSTKPLFYLGLSCADLLWSIFPTYIAVFYRQLLGSIDKFYRVTQPYADLHYGNASLETLELNYGGDVFPIVTIKALRKKHWRVALSSFLSFTSSPLPAFATSIFFMGYPENSDELRLFIYPSAFKLAMIAMGLLSLTFIALVPSRLYFMPHPLETFADHLSLLYNSSLLQERAFTFRPHTGHSIWSGIFGHGLSREMAEFRDRNPRGFSMGIRKACISSDKCGGPHGICIDASGRVNPYHVEADKEPGTRWKKIKHIISSV